MQQLVKVYIWGTGCESEKCLASIDLKKCMLLGYIETNPIKTTWREKRVYSAEILVKSQYDYLIIANTYYEEILKYIRDNNLSEINNIINWIKFRECIYNYSCKIWEIFKIDFINNNYYLFGHAKGQFNCKFSEKLNKYKKIYIYDIRLIDCELDIGNLINEILINLKNTQIGMVFIPNEDFLDENWYHNLLYILDRKAIVIWNNAEKAFEKYLKKNAGVFSFERFNLLQFKRKEIRKVHKGKYMKFEPKLTYVENNILINQVKCIKIFTLRCDRIGEEIRVLNKVLLEERETNEFRIYLPIDTYGRPFIGTNACFNELLGRKIKLLKNPEEYYLWISDIFEKFNKYEYISEWIDVYHSSSSLLENSNPLLDFYDNELELGRNLIRNELKIRGKYVCVFTRDAEYLKNTLPEADCSYHNYRNFSFDVLNKAIEYFNRNNIQTVRMGQLAEERMIHEKCINFANTGYDEFLDLILLRFCKFFVGADSGIWLLASFFGKPMLLMLNIFPTVGFSNMIFHNKDMFIVRRIYHLKEHRELSFLEIISSSILFEVEGKVRGEYWEQNNLELITFSQDDVLEASKEMNEKLNGTWVDQEEDLKLLEKYRLVLEKAIKKFTIDTSKIPPINISITYLRRYQYLL